MCVCPSHATFPFLPHTHTRIHNDTVSVVQEENKFFAKELPILVKGGTFNLESEDGTVVKGAKCKLTPDHR